jgi:hypothetical protein
VNRQAAEMGYDAGTPEYDRLKRMMQADLFVLGLASIVPWSIFGNAVAPPFNQLKEASKVVFGDEDERERAFYGADWGALNWAKPVAKPFMPPAARVPEGLFRLMMTQDWQRFTGYTISSWFPFGRVTRDGIKAIANPAVAPERLLGIPVVTAASGPSVAQSGSRPFGQAGRANAQGAGNFVAERLLGRNERPDALTTGQLTQPLE